MNVNFLEIKKMTIALYCRLDWIKKTHGLMGSGIAGTNSYP